LRWKSDFSYVPRPQFEPVAGKGGGGGDCPAGTKKTAWCLPGATEKRWRPREKKVGEPSVSLQQKRSAAKRAQKEKIFAPISERGGKKKKEDRDARSPFLGHGKEKK